MSTLVNPFTTPGQWYKANLHCHTTLSDGEATPQQRIDQCAEAGYQILALTDHWTTNDLSALDSRGLLLIGGIEVHPSRGDKPMHHFVGLGVTHPYTTERDDPLPAQERIDDLRARGAEVIYAHPRWTGQNVHDMLALDGWRAFEIYNSTCAKVGRPESDAIWDDLCEAGVLVGGLASDDVHRGRDIFRAWTMFKMPEPTFDAFMTALRTGAYYATCGPEIKRFEIGDDGQAVVECSPAREVHLHATAPGGRSFYADEQGGPIERIEFSIDPRWGWRYVRLTVVDAEGRKAWGNPVELG